LSHSFNLLRNTFFRKKIFGFFFWIGKTENHFFVKKKNNLWKNFESLNCPNKSRGFWTLLSIFFQEKNFFDHFEIFLRGKKYFKKLEKTQFPIKKGLGKKRGKNVNDTSKKMDGSFFSQSKNFYHREI